MTPSLVLALCLHLLLQQPPSLNGQALKRPLPPAQQDCNGNGLSDAWEIAQGLVEDCQGDGIPDSCQLAESWVYRHDDGLMDNAVGWGTPYLCWLNQYVVQPGQEVITEVQLAWGVLPPGSPATLLIWSDPNGDADPTDAQVLVAVPVAVEDDVVAVA